MSWLSRSIADTLRIDGNDEDSDEGEEDEKNGYKESPLNLKQEEGEDEDEEEEDRAGRGVREDLSEFRETLTRQLWGVASFLAPSPPPPPPPLPQPRRLVDRSFVDRNRREPRGVQSCSGSEGDSEVEDSGGIRTGIQNQTSFTQFEQEKDPIGDAVGITEEVLAFAMNIAHHPETWLDFPSEEEEDIDDFDMSDAQHKHALAIQRLAARLAALRIELCPAHMSDGYFWKVYFVLLHSRLNKQDADLLSTPQIVAARAIWMQELQKRTKEETDWSIKGSSDVKDRVSKWNDSFDHGLSDNSTRSMSPRTSFFGPATYSLRTELETEKHPIVVTETQFVDKAVIEEEPVKKGECKDLGAGPSFNQYPQNYVDDEEDDDWLKEDSELEGYNTTAIVVGNDEDVSFSDLEDDEDCTIPVNLR